MMPQCTTASWRSLLGVGLVCVGVTDRLLVAQTVPQVPPASSIVPPISSRGDETTVAPVMASDVAPWLSRLHALDPSDPEAYLLLGEEMVDTAQSPQARRIAVELLVLAFDIARTRDASSPIATSACLALADLAPSRRERLRLRSLAGALTPRSRAAQGTLLLHAESPAYVASTTLGLARTGLGFHARILARKPEVAQQLDAIDGLLERFGVPGGTDSVLREIRRWPCAQCANQRLIRRRDGREARLCPTCQGVPGPRLPHAQLLGYLRAEFWLVRDAKQPWSLQVLLGDGEPAQLADPTIVARSFGVDSSRRYWRANAWRTNADGSDMPPPRVGAALPPLPNATREGEQPPAPDAPAGSPTAPFTPAPTTPAPTIPLPTPPITLPTIPRPDPTDPNQKPLPGEEPYPFPPTVPPPK